MFPIRNYYISVPTAIIIIAALYFFIFFLLLLVCFNSFFSPKDFNLKRNLAFCNRVATATDINFW